MTSQHNAHNLALAENIRKFTNSFATHEESAQGLSSVDEERIDSKLEELWPPLHLLTNLIWELLLDAMLVVGNDLEAFVKRNDQITDSGD